MIFLKIVRFPWTNLDKVLKIVNFDLCTILSVMIV